MSTSKSRMLDAVKKDVEKFLYRDQENAFTRAMEWVEQKTGQKRERCLYVLLGLYGVYLVIGHGAALVCNLSGFLFPAYASIIAIRTEDKGDDTQWLIYWTVFAVLSIVDFGSEQILSWFPLYWLLKSVFFFWLYFPATRGAEIIYRRLLDPLLDRYGSAVEADLAQVNTKSLQGLISTEPFSEQLNEENLRKRLNKEAKSGQ